MSLKEESETVTELEPSSTLDIDWDVKSTVAQKILDTDEAWETGLLGCDPKYARRASDKFQKEMNEMLGIVPFQGVMAKELHDQYVEHGRVNTLAYQYLIKEALKEYANNHF